MKVKEFDKKFDEGEDITKYLDFSKAYRVAPPARLNQQKISDKFSMFYPTSVWFLLPQNPWW